MKANAFDMLIKKKLNDVSSFELISIASISNYFYNFFKFKYQIYIYYVYNITYF